MNHNKKEFVELVEKYESLTIGEIEDAWVNNSWASSGHDTAKQLTGFGGPFSCTLCVAITRNCDGCVYGKRYGCLSGKNKKSYDDIDDAESPRKLLNAFRRRAKHMRRSYPELFNTKIM